MEQGTQFKENSKDPQLWHIAKKRVSFRYHLLTYTAVITSLWVLWSVAPNDATDREYFPWPVFPTLGWGIGLFFHFMGAYIFPRQNLVEKEYRKLIEQKTNY
jgi:hypothetical protein